MPGSVSGRPPTGTTPGEPRQGRETGPAQPGELSAEQRELLPGKARRVGHEPPFHRQLDAAAEIRQLFGASRFTGLSEASHRAAVAAQDLLEDTSTRVLEAGPSQPSAQEVFRRANASARCHPDDVTVVARRRPARRPAHRPPSVTAQTVPPSWCEVKTVPEPTSP